MADPELKGIFMKLRGTIRGLRGLWSLLSTLRVSSLWWGCSVVLYSGFVRVKSSDKSLLRLTTAPSLFQTNELVMSTEDDDQLILQEDQTLRAAGVGKSCSSFQSGRTLMVPRSTAFTAGTSALWLEIVCRRKVLHDSKVSDETASGLCSHEDPEIFKRTGFQRSQTDGCSSGDGAAASQLGCLCVFTAHETEVAFFNKEDYGLYKANPTTSWWPPAKVCEGQTFSAFG